MKKKLLTMLMILGLVIAQIPGAGVITASAAGARNYLAALNGGNVHWEEATDGDAKIGDVYAGSQIEFAGYYELPEGSSVNLTAIPLGSNTFVGWYTSWNSTEPVLVSDSPTYTWTLPTESGMTLTAVFEEAVQPPDVVVLVPIPAVTVNFTVPAAGSSVSDIMNNVSVPEGGHYFLLPAGACYDQEPELDIVGNPVTEPFTGNFEAGKTYYLGIQLQADPGYMFQQGYGDVPNTTVTVNGATSLYGNDLSIWNMARETEPGIFEQISWGYVMVSFTIPAAAPENVFIDNTVDNSKSYITGVVHLTGAGGTQAGYNNEDGTGKTVYSAEATVTYTNPKTSTVQGYINDAYTQTYNLANACKNAGKSGEFHMSTSETTGKVWDNSRYRTFEYNPETSQWEYTNGSGETEVYTGTVPAEAGPATKIHLADGDFGKETFYKVEANGWVSGWNITVSNDGNGSASADLAASLANETVTLTATPSDGYAFKEWQVVSGGAALTDSTAASTTFTMPASDVEIKAIFQSTHVHTLVKTEKVEPGCETTGTEAYWTCSECEKLFSDEAGTTVITAPVTIAALGHNWSEWQVVKEATETEDGKETRSCSRCPETETRVIPHLEVEYRNTEGDGSTWVKGSTDSLTFVFKRSVNDETTFSHFTGIAIDGTAVEATNYEAVSGSVKITLKPDYLKTLATGKHAITAMFDDADAATANFTVAEPTPAPTATPSPTKAPDNKTPNTGDTNNIWIWGFMFIVSLTALLFATNKQGRRR